MWNNFQTDKWQKPPTLIMICLPFLEWEPFFAEYLVASIFFIEGVLFVCNSSVTCNKIICGFVDKL